MYRHILLPTDGSELAERGVAHGLALAKSVGAKVYVIYVVEPLLAVTGDFASVLDRAENAAKEAGVSCETIQVENVEPHQAIIAAAEDKGCNLIVMSWHGRSGLSTLLIGSVKQGTDLRENPRTGLSMKCRPIEDQARGVMEIMSGWGQEHRFRDVPLQFGHNDVSVSSTLKFGANSRPCFGTKFAELRLRGIRERRSQGG